MSDCGPIYQQIEAYIMDKIESGEWGVGDQIPKERELCDMFNASRMTVSKALGNLVLKGMIYRNAGKGSFVRMTCPESKVRSMFSFSEKMRILGKEPQSKVREYSIIFAETAPAIRDILQLHDGDFLHRISRIRITDGSPMAAELIFLSAPVVPTIDTRVIEKSIFEYLEQTLGLQISRSDVKIQAVSSTPAINDIFCQQITQPLLKVTSTSYLSNEIPFEISETYYLADKYEYTTTNFRQANII